MAEEKLERANFYGDEKIITGRGGAAGGSGGGGMGLTGGAYVPAEGGITTTNRWLRFDFNDPNHKSLIILGGTSFTIGENIVTIDETTSYSLTDYISEEGTDYYVFINTEGRVIASTIRTPADNYMFIGQFHTLCADCNENMTGIVSVGTISKQIGDFVDIQNYFPERDLDFYNFYHKEIRSVNNGSYYNVVTIDHSLSGFKAGDILPESVWCLNWHPSSKKWDGMVWCNMANICTDIYLQSGTSIETASEYGSVATNNYFLNLNNDLSMIGKRFLIFNEFDKISVGSNQLTLINADSPTTGGHVDTAGRRMISFIGCEDCCGFKLQVLNEITCWDRSEGFRSDDGRGLFGKGRDDSTFLTGGGLIGDPNNTSGSRQIRCSPISNGMITPYFSRGCCDITIV